MIHWAIVVHLKLEIYEMKINVNILGFVNIRLVGRMSRVFV